MNIERLKAIAELLGGSSYGYEMQDGLIAVTLSGEVVANITLAGVDRILVAPLAPVNGEIGELKNLLEKGKSRFERIVVCHPNQRTVRLFNPYLGKRPLPPL